MRLGKTDYNAISATEYVGGAVTLRHLRLDVASGRVIADEILTLDEQAGEALSGKELLLLGAAELLGRELYGQTALG